MWHQSFVAVVAGAVLAGAALAHGGQYRRIPPSLPPGVPAGAPGGGLGGGGNGSGGPTTGGPVAPSAPRPSAPVRVANGPTTGAPPPDATASDWQDWWEFNKEPFLRRMTARRSLPVTGSDDFYLGARRGEAAIDVLLPTAAELEDRIVPALARLLATEQNRDVQSAALVALGKIGRDGTGVALEQVLAARITRDDQEVRETAVLSLGIAGRQRALPTLLSLLTDGSEGRQLVEREEVGVRTRAFAAYALGLCARREVSGVLKQQVRDRLWAVVQDPGEQNRDLRTAAVTALGVIAADPDRVSDKRLRWQTVEQLMAWFEKPLGATDELVQAHAPIAVARLLGRGTSDLHARCKERLVATLQAARQRGNAIRQSAAIALGMLGVPEDEHAADAAVSRALRACYQEGHDQSARRFAVISLGRIGGAANREWLSSAYPRSNKHDERPWLAIALGLLAAPAAAAGESDARIAELLLDDLESASNDTLRSALAVGIGLTGHEPAVPTMLRLLREFEGREQVAGYLCVSLALLGDPVAVPTLTEILERSRRRPFLLLQCAVALGCLGDRNATPRLTRMLEASESAAVLSALATAIGRIGDRRAIDPLLEMAADKELTKLARAFVVAALGGIGDKDELPWNAPFGVDSNYAAAVDTLTNGRAGVLDIL